MQQWHVSVRGEPRKLVGCARVEFGDEFVVFIHSDGQPILLVRRTELLAVERYEEPPF